MTRESLLELRMVHEVVIRIGLSAYSQYHHDSTWWLKQDSSTEPHSRKTLHRDSYSHG